MRIIDAHTGLDVKIGMCLPLPGSGSTPERSRRGEGVAGWYKVAAITPGPLGMLLNQIGYRLLGMGFVQPKVLIVANEAHGGRQWVPLQVRTEHPSFPGQTVAFIPS